MTSYFVKLGCRKDETDGRKTNCDFVVDGNVKVASKLRDVVLDIVGFDNLGEYVEPAFTGILY